MASAAGARSRGGRAHEREAPAQPRRTARPALAPAAAAPSGPPPPPARSRAPAPCEPAPLPCASTLARLLHPAAPCLGEEGEWGRHRPRSAELALVLAGRSGGPFGGDPCGCCAYAAPPCPQGQVYVRSCPTVPRGTGARVECAPTRGKQARPRSKGLPPPHCLQQQAQASNKLCYGSLGLTTCVEWGRLNVQIFDFIVGFSPFTPHSNLN
jgi:hypothetical protein